MNEPCIRPRLALSTALALLVLLAPFSGRTPAADGPAKGRLFFVGVAYDEAPPKGKTGAHFNYAPDNFSDLLAERAKDYFTEIRASTLKDKAVTHDGVMAHLLAIRKAVKKDDLVFFYWGTHGGTGPKGWVASGADGSVIQGRELKEVLGTYPCPVIVAISTCGSGGFAVPTAKDVPVPQNVCAFCACRRQKSTGNQLDIAMCEALAGFADFDGDGQVTLKEVIDYVPRRYHEWTPDEKTRATDDLPVLQHSDSAPLDRPLTKVNGDHFGVEKEGQWYGAVKTGMKNGKTRVRFLGFDHTTKDGGYSMPDQLIEDEHLDLPGGPPAVMVEWKGQWYPAIVLEKKENGFKIHYVGYPASDDETVKRDRIRVNFGVRNLLAVEPKK